MAGHDIPVDFSSRLTIPVHSISQTLCIIYVRCVIDIACIIWVIWYALQKIHCMVCSTYIHTWHACIHANIQTYLQTYHAGSHMDTSIHRWIHYMQSFLRLLLFHSFRHVFVVLCFIIFLIHRCMLSFIVSLRYSFYHVIECNRVCLHVSMHVFIHILRHIYLYYIHTDAMQTLIDA